MNPLRRAEWFVSVVFFVGPSALLTAQPPDRVPQHQGVPQSFSPFRLEMGAYGSWVDRDFGFWRGLTGQLWFRGNPRFVPAFLVDSQTRPTGTQQNYTFLSYANWTGSFYTVQGFSLAPERNDEAIFFPTWRYDVKAFWKLPPGRNFVLAGGFTQYDVGTLGSGQIFNAGALYYRGKWVLEGNAFLNRTQPGDLFSGAGSLAAQYGSEGDYWFGISAAGGREIYQRIGLVPLDVRFTGYSVNSFYRRWFTRHVGAVVSLDFQHKIDGFRRIGLASNVFFEF